jgi:hypothetical protein
VPRSMPSTFAIRLHLAFLERAKVAVRAAPSEAASGVCHELIQHPEGRERFPQGGVQALAQRSEVLGMLERVDDVRQLLG